MKKIVVVGAGPGGLAAAIESMKNGCEVQVLEAKTSISYKVCAGGISKADFNKFDFPEDIRRIITKTICKTFGEYKIVTPWQSVIVKSDGQTAATLDRKMLHEYMAEEAERLGAKICFGEKVTAIKGNSVITAAGHQYAFDYLIGADGSNSTVRKIIGLDKERVVLAIQYMIPIDHPEIVFYIDKKKLGVSYGWIFPQKGRISVGTGKYFPVHDHLSMQKLRYNLDDWIGEKFGPEVLGKATFEAFPILLDYKGHEFGNIFLVGDAAGLANDLTGGGIISAIASARYVVKKIMDPEYKGQEIEKILKAKDNSRKLFQLMANPLIGRSVAETFVFLLNLSFFRRRLGHALM